MIGEDGNSGATGEPTPADRPRWQPRPIKVRGREVVVDSEEKAVELMQKGAAADERFALAKQEREATARERQEIAAEKARLARLAAVDEILTTDPEKRAKVNAIINGADVESDSDDPYLREIETRDRRQQAMIADLTDKVNRLSAGLTQGIGSVRRERVLDAEERNLKRNYPQLATDERIDEARQLAEQRGLSLEEAFRISSFDDMPEIVRGQVFTELGVDPTRLSPARGEDLNLEGIGPVKDGDLNRLFEEDPDKYARIRPQMRSWRLRRSGKAEVPR